MKDRQLPARDLWKHAIVRTGSVQPFLSQSLIFKKIRGAAGADYFVLLTGACPLFGTFSAEDDIAKVTIFAGMQILKGCNGHFRQLINLCYFKKIRKLLAIEDRLLPARDLWKHAIVRPGTSPAFIKIKTILTIE